jgi:hypothetical protein
VAVVPGVGAQQAAAVTQETGPVPDIVTGLTEDATTLDLNDLGALLAANPQAVTRTVQDIEPTGDSFLLGSLFDFASGNGLIGCFNPATKRVSRFRLTRRVELHRYLNAVPPGESLFWTRKRLTTWSLPYYPYRQISPGQFRRLVGGIPLEYM